MPPLLAPTFHNLFPFLITKKGLFKDTLIISVLGNWDEQAAPPSNTYSCDVFYERRKEIS